MVKYNSNIVWHQHVITRIDREQKHGHKAALIWFTGLSGSGKSTLAGELEKILHYQLSTSTYLLDGDNIRHGLCSDLDFSDNSRKENIRRVGEVAKLMVDAGLIVLAAFISPHRHERRIVRNLFENKQFIEVFVDTPLVTCEARDPKNLYKKARCKKLKNFTGIDNFYEIPYNPEVHLDGKRPVLKLIKELLDFLNHQNIICL